MSTRKAKHVNKLTKHQRRRRKIDGWCVLFGALHALLASNNLFASTTAAPDPRWQDAQAIESTASQYIKDRLKHSAAETDVQANRLDPRLRLAACDEELEAFLRPGAKIGPRTVVGVRCTGTRSWKVYVPVDLVVTANVLTAKHTLPRGHLITANDLVRDRRDVSRMHTGYFSQPSALVGQRVRIQLPVGRVISPSMIEADKIVRRGQTVTLSVAGAAISIQMSGKALQDGGLHQRIRVRNENSGRIVEGLVRSAEHVEVLVPSSSRVFSNTPKVSATVADTRLSNNDR